MTESEWLACDYPLPMLKYLWHGRINRRKMRLFACACCRRIWLHLIDSRSRWAVEAAERFADGDVGQTERLAALIGAENATHDAEGNLEGVFTANDARAAREEFAACNAAVAAAQLVEGEACGLYCGWYLGATAVLEVLTEHSQQVPLLRDMIGNPFRPTPVVPCWSIPIAVTLARAAYDDRIMPAGHLEPARLGLLADALEDAGCTDAAILEHLRGPGPHVRGCWVVDLLLEKS